MIDVPEHIVLPERFKSQASQIEKIIHSRAFLDADTSSKLLVFLTQRSNGSHPEQLKEYEIATEGLGRRADFDPR